MSEVRATSETGGMKGRKPQALSTIDPDALWTLAEVAGKGAEKYEAYNYLKGYNWSWSYDALQRHLMQFWGGQDMDADDGLPHLAHAAWHCLALLSFMQREIGTDDRPPTMRKELDDTKWDWDSLNRTLIPEATWKDATLPSLTTYIDEVNKYATKTAKLTATPYSFPVRVMLGAEKPSGVWANSGYRDTEPPIAFDDVTVNDLEARGWEHIGYTDEAFHVTPASTRGIDDCTACTHAVESRLGRVPMT